MLLYCLIQFAREKAAELEAYGETPPEKKRCLVGGGGGEGERGDGRDERGGGEGKRGDGGEEGGKRGGGEVDRFLTAVSCLPLAELGEEAARVRLADMVAELASSPHVRELIDTTH